MRPAAVIMIMAWNIALSSAAVAQQMPGPAAGGPTGSAHREETRRKVEAIRIARLTERLQLDEKTAAKFIPAITAIEQKRRARMSEHREAMQDLRRQLEVQPPDQGKLRAALEKLSVIQREAFKLREKEWETARDHLSVEQQARYIVFQQEFMQEVRDIVGAGRGPGPGGPRRGGPPPNAPSGAQ